MVLGTRERFAITDFFNALPDFRAGRLNKRAIAASETAVMAFEHEKRSAKLPFFLQLPGMDVFKNRLIGLACRTD